SPLLFTVCLAFSLTRLQEKISGDIIMIRKYFMVLILNHSVQQQVQIYHWDYKYKTIQPVQKPAVSGNQFSAVFSVKASFQFGFHYIADGRADGNNQPDDDPVDMTFGQNVFFNHK